MPETQREEFRSTWTSMYHARNAICCTSYRLVDTTAFSTFLYCDKIETWSKNFFTIIKFYEKNNKSTLMKKNIYCSVRMFD